MPTESVVRPMHIDTGSHNPPRISLTPLIDVVFILLVFFMLATRFGDWRDLSLNVTAPPPVTQQQPDVIQVHVLSQHQVRVQGQDMPLDQLSGLLRQRQPVDIRLSGDDAVSIEVFLVIADQIQAIGVAAPSLDLLP